MSCFRWLAVVTAIVACAAGCTPVVSDRPAAPPPPESLPGALTPTELTVRASPQPDGSLKVVETLVFDAGPGRSEPLHWAIGGAGIGWYGENGERRSGQYWVDPQVSELTASSGGEPLTITADDSQADGTSLGYHRYQLGPAQDWAPDRHLVSISYLLSGVHVLHNGAPTMVLPLNFVGQSADAYVRVEVDSGQPLWCLSNNIDATTQTECDGASDGTISWIGDYDNAVEAVGIRDPENVEAPPIEPLRRT